MKQIEISEINNYNIASGKITRRGANYVRFRRVFI